MSRVTFLGLGAMGSRMAANLIKGGHEVTVWNRTTAATDELVNIGAKKADTPADAAKEAEYVISMVRDDDASEYVWLDSGQGALSTMPEGAIAIEMSTLTPDYIQNLNVECTERKLHFIDAPVAGSRPQAEAGVLIIMAGADEKILAKAEPVLSLMGQTIHHVGPVCSGSILKLVVNTLFGIQATAMAELLKYMDKQTMDLPGALKVLSSIPVTSPAATGVATMMQAKNFTPQFPIELVEKDFQYMLQSASKAEADMPVADAAHKIFAKAIEQGFGVDNISGVIQVK